LAFVTALADYKALSAPDGCRTWPAEPMLIARDWDRISIDPIRSVCHERSHLPKAADSEVGTKPPSEARDQPRSRLIEELHTIGHHDEHWTVLIERRSCK